MIAPALETRGLRLSFGALAVADTIDFQLAPGARHALIGPNGAGKTTFVNLVTGRLAPDGGQVFLEGREITPLSPHRRVKLGLARSFQINSLFNRLTVIENVALGVFEREGFGWRMFRPARRHGAALDEAHEILRTLGLAQDAHKPVRALSYGRQRLVEIALGFAVKPRVLLLDEPAAGVPSGESGTILDLLDRLPDDIAILMIEHDMDLVFRFSRRISVLSQGRLLVEGEPAEIAADDRVRAIYFGERGVAHA